MQMQEEQLKTLFAWAKEPKLVLRCKGCEVVGMQALKSRRARKRMLRKDLVLSNMLIFISYRHYTYNMYIYIYIHIRI